MITYQINGIYKIAELNKYNEGCQLDGGSAHNIDITLQNNNILDLIKEFSEFTNCPVPQILECNDFFDEGRIDAQCLENGDSFEASQNELKLWKQDKINLYHCTYIAIIEKIEKHTINIEDELKLLKKTA